MDAVACNHHCIFKSMQTAADGAMSVKGTDTNVFRLPLLLQQPLVLVPELMLAARMALQDGGAEAADFQLAEHDHNKQCGKPS